MPSRPGGGKTRWPRSRRMEALLPAAKQPGRAPYAWNNADASTRGLERATEAGNWKVAAQAHAELLKKAVTGKTLVHLHDLVALMREESGADEEQVERLQIARTSARIAKRVEERGGVTDSACLAVVEALQKLGLKEPAQLWRAGGIRREIGGFLAAADRARRSRERNLEMISRMFEVAE